MRLVCFGFYLNGSKAQACLAHIEGCKEGRSTQYFPLNVKKSMDIVMFSEPRIFALKGEKRCLITPSLAGLSRQSVTANTSLHTSDDTPAVDSCVSWNLTSGLQVSLWVPVASRELLHGAQESRWLCFCAQSKQTGGEWGINV